MTNIILENFETVPFSKINNGDYLPAIVKLIQKTKEEIKNISSNQDDATFSNTIEALEESGEKLNRASLIFSNINSAETNDEIQKIAQEIYPLLSGLENDIFLGLFFESHHLFLQN
jgi:peptidyl-dipeptidase Dcp